MQSKCLILHSTLSIFSSVARLLTTIGTPTDNTTPLSQVLIRRPAYIWALVHLLACNVHLLKASANGNLGHWNFVSPNFWMFSETIWKEIKHANINVPLKGYRKRKNVKALGKFPYLANANFLVDIKRIINGGRHCCWGYQKRFEILGSKSSLIAEILKIRCSIQEPQLAMWW